MTAGMENMDPLLQSWPLGEIASVTPISSGSSCRTFSVQAKSGNYILRGFPAQRQAEQEQAVAKALLGTGIGPEWIPTVTGEFYLTFQNLFYNLQKRLSGVQPDLSEEQQILSAAESVASLHSTLSGHACACSDYDRFSTIRLLRRAADMPLPDGLFPQNITTLPEREAFLQKTEGALSSSEIIHGDLGSWNMLWDGKKMHIIDFGECRAGDFHFDVAAVVCSILSGYARREDFLRRLDLFQAAYEKHFQPIDRQKLHVSVYLWLLRGALASASIPEPERRAKCCRRFAHEIARYQRYVHPA